jgi:hypothetical protein
MALAAVSERAPVDPLHTWPRGKVDSLTNKVSINGVQAQMVYQKIGLANVAELSGHLDLKTAGDLKGLVAQATQRSSDKHRRMYRRPIPSE